jgi:hypothetical protein
MLGTSPLGRFALGQFPEWYRVAPILEVTNTTKVIYVLAEDRDMVVGPRKREC